MGLVQILMVSLATSSPETLLLQQGVMECKLICIHALVLLRFLQMHGSIINLKLSPLVKINVWYGVN
jgi:hypothetical protein